ERDDIHTLCTQLARADRHLHTGGDLDAAQSLGECWHQCSPSQKCWMRVHASCSSSVALAYAMRKCPGKQNAEPWTAATPVSSSSASTKLSSSSIRLPPRVILPMQPWIEGYT